MTRDTGPLGGNLDSRSLARLLNVVFARLLELVAQARVLLHLAREVLQRLELLEVAPPAIEATVAFVPCRVLCAICGEVALNPLHPHKLSEVAVSFVRSLPANRARI